MIVFLTFNFFLECVAFDEADDFFVRFVDFNGDF